MFSMTPPISRSTLWAISAARRATFWATGWGVVEHRPAPDDRGVLLDEEADRHDLHAVGVERQDLALGRDLRPAADVEHARDRVAPHVGVEDAHLLALRRERGGQVRGDRRLAHAALAGA